MIPGLLYAAPAIQPGYPPAGFTEVKLEGQEDCVAWLHQAKPNRPLIVYFHGNAENLETLKQSEVLEMLSGFDFPVLAVEYPGYGSCRGQPSEDAILRTTDDAVRWVRKIPKSPGWISAGWSLGGAVAVQAALRNPDGLKSMIVLSGWTSLKDVAMLHYPHWMVKSFLKEAYDSKKAAPQIIVPVLVVHGEQDGIIPATQGHDLAASFPSGRWIPIADTGHNDLLSNPQVRTQLASFLQQFQ